MRLHSIALVVVCAVATVLVPFSASAAPFRIGVYRAGWNAYEFRVADGVGAPLAVLWRFGDGIISGDRIAYHAFGGPGDYTVTVEITDTAGAVQQVQTVVSISFFSPGNWQAWGIAFVVAAAAVFLAIAARRLKHAAEECAA
jgi:hypothetical protein